MRCLRKRLNIADKVPIGFRRGQLLVLAIAQQIIITTKTTTTTITITMFVQWVITTQVMGAA